MMAGTKIHTHTHTKRAEVHRTPHSHDLAIFVSCKDKEKNIKIYNDKIYIVYYYYIGHEQMCADDVSAYNWARALRPTALLRMRDLKKKKA